MGEEGQDQVKAVANVIQNTLDSINVLHAQLHAGGEPYPDGEEKYSAPNFWQKFDDIAKVVSHECTKIALVYRQTPYPTTESLSSLLSGLEQGLVALVSCFYGLPKSQGLTLRLTVRKTLMFIVESVHGLLCDIKALDHSDPGQKQLQSTGTAWEACDRVSRLPRDNRQATLKAVKRELGLVTDAVEELQEEIQSHSSQVSDPQLDNSELWSNRDRELLPSCLGLVKTSKALMKKLEEAVEKNGKIDTEEDIIQLDDVSELVSGLSPAVDDFVLCTYPPVRKEELKKQTDLLADELVTLINKIEATDITQEVDKTWIEFLRKAVNHNRDKLNTLLDNVHQ